MSTWCNEDLWKTIYYDYELISDLVTGSKHPRISQVYRLNKVFFIYNWVLTLYDLALQITQVDICQFLVIQGI